MPVPLPQYLWIVAVLTGLLIPGCISVSSPTNPPTAPPQFVTSTLPPTKSLVQLPTGTPSTPVTGTTTPTLAVTAPAECKVQAVLLQDVTIPDDTLIPAGETFTKTWRFKNTGTCHWQGYTINFLTGDRMGAPDSAPIPDTLAGDTVDVSLELTAPTVNGSYSAYFTLKDAEGESIDIGTEKTFWLKIIVEDGAESSVSTATCDVGQNTGYVEQIATLINDERKNNDLPELTINVKLTTAAQAHAEDMACNNILSHTGSDGSYVDTRIAATGYSASFSEEITYADGTPQDAFDWWMSDKPHRDAILSNISTEMGIGFASVESSTYGGYFTVDFAAP